MSIADQIAVMDHSRIEQVGTPRELYDRPSTPFVMGFLGPVSQVGETLVRPHDIALAAQAGDGAREAMVSRVVHLGFEVRAELMLSDGSAVTAQLTRTEADELELAQGDIVWLRASGSTLLA
jgi:sulfate transport system ATP-binding protein